MGSEMNESAQRQARWLIRSRARTFYLASLFLPKRLRRDVHLAYSYFRTIDDVVDEPRGRSRDQLLEILARWEDVLTGSSSPSDPLMVEVVRVADRYHIPPAYLGMVIEGARSDLDMRVLETFDDLINYSALVAGSVGIVMAHIMGASDEGAFHAANDLGIAMQLTNVLRDVGEDLQRDRVYLPRVALNSAGCSLESLRRQEVTPAFRVVMRSLVNEARQRYQRGMHGIPHLDPSAQFAIYLAATLYAQILVKIERHDFDVFSRRARVGYVEKWMLALPAYAHHRTPGL